MTNSFNEKEKKKTEDTNLSLIGRFNKFVFSKNVFRVIFAFFTIVCFLITLLAEYYDLPNKFHFLFLFLFPVYLMAFYNFKVSIVFAIFVSVWYSGLRILNLLFFQNSFSDITKEIFIPFIIFAGFTVLIILMSKPRTQEITDLQEEKEYLLNRKNVQDQEIAFFRTQLQNIEQVLEETERSTQALFKQFNGAVLSLNNDLYVTYSNDKFLQFIGKPEREILGRNISILPDFFQYLRIKKNTFELKSRVSGARKNFIWNISHIIPDSNKKSPFYLIIGVESPNENI